MFSVFHVLTINVPKHLTFSKSPHMRVHQPHLKTCTPMGSAEVKGKPPQTTDRLGSKRLL